MSSKLLRLLIALGSISLVSCSLTTDDPAPPTAGVSIKNLESGCLDSAGETLAKYFDGKASQEEWAGFWACVDKSFRTFADNTRGQNPDEYTGDELKSFLERYFLKDKVIQPALSDQALRLKRAILGGSPSGVTREEIRKTLDLIAVFKVESERLRPYLPLNVNTTRQKSIADLIRALEVFTSVTDNIGKTLAGSVNAYAFADFAQLLTELEVFFKQGAAVPQTTEWLRTAIDYVDVIKWAKSVLIVPTESEIATGDWDKVFYIVPRYVSLYIRMDSLGNSTDRVLSNNGLTRLRNISTDLYSLLSRSLEHHPDQVIAYSELDHLLDAMADRKLLPFKSSVMKEFLRTLFHKILRPPGQLFNEEADGLRQNNLDRLLHEYSIWSEGQFYLDGLYRTLGSDDVINSPGLERSTFLSVTPEEAVQWTQQHDQLSLDAINDLQRTVMENPPFFPAGAKAIVIPEDRTNFIYSFNNMTQMNWLKRGTTLLIDSYKSYVPAPDPKSKAPPANCGNNAINIEQANKMFGEFFEVLKAMGFLSENGRTMAPSRFFESSLFLTSSNGDPCLQINEGIQLLASLFSVAQKAPEAFNDIKAHGGCTVKENPATGEVDMDLPCVWRNLYAGRAKYWSQVPGFVRYLDRMQAEQDHDTNHKQEMPAKVKQVFEDIYKLAKAHDANKLWTNVGEIQGFMLMPYYVEMIFDRFDTDDSTEIDQAEAKVGFDEVFVHTLQKYMGLFGLAPTVKNAEAAYTYLLAKGNAPTGCVEKASFFLVWRNTYQKKNFTADRSRIYSIFSMLIDKINKSNEGGADQPVKSDCELFDWLSKLFGGKKKDLSSQQESDAISDDYDRYMRQK